MILDTMQAPPPFACTLKKSGRLGTGLRFTTLVAGLSFRCMDTNSLCVAMTCTVHTDDIYLTVSAEGVFGIS